MPSSACTAATWPALVDATLKAYEAERTKSKEKDKPTRSKAGSVPKPPPVGADPHGTNAGKQMRKLLQCADSEHRSGEAWCCSSVEVGGTAELVCNALHAMQAEESVRGGGG